MADNAAMSKFNSELRSDAREQLKGMWGGAILSCVIYIVITSAALGAAGIGALIIGGPMELGPATYFLLLTRRESAQIEDLFKGFRKFESALVLYLVRTVYVARWSLLFVVPGIVAALRYSRAVAPKDGTPADGA